MSDIQKRMSDIAEQIEEGKKKKATLEGRRVELKKTLQQLLGVKTVKEAEDKLKKIEEECDSLESSIKKDLNTLEKEFKWETD